MLDDAALDVKVDFFVEGEKTNKQTNNPEKNPRSQIEINQSQPMYEPRIESGLQCWETGMMATEPTY